MSLSKVSWLRVPLNTTATPRAEMKVLNPMTDLSADAGSPFLTAPASVDGNEDQQVTFVIQVNNAQGDDFLSLSATSDNPALIDPLDTNPTDTVSGFPDYRITYAGADTWDVTVQGKTHQFGTANLTFTVDSFGYPTALTETIPVNIAQVNYPPQVGGLNTTVYTIGPGGTAAIPIGFSDTGESPSQLSVSTSGASPSWLDASIINNSASDTSIIPSFCRHENSAELACL